MMVEIALARYRAIKAIKEGGPEAQVRDKGEEEKEEDQEEDRGKQEEEEDDPW